MQDRSTELRAFFAHYVTQLGEVHDPRIEQAFASVPREPFAGKGPWSICVPGRGYVQTPNDDITFIYQNTLVALDPARGINIGEPSGHARWLDARGVKEGETVLQIGAGSGYYTALLAYLAGAEGKIHAYEIEKDLAARARENLRHLEQVEVHARTGIADDLPKADAIYVNAGITQPSWAWLDALKPGGRLLFPLHMPGHWGGMLRIVRPRFGSAWPAKFISQAIFIPCVGPQDPEVGRRLNAAFAGGIERRVRSFRIDKPIDETCWFKGDGWWLSTSESDDALAA